jgi:hypothetical protein
MTRGSRGRTPLRNISVEAHQTITRRSHFCSDLNRRISARRASALSIRVFPCFTFVPLNFFTQWLSKTADIGLIDSRDARTFCTCASRRTPALHAASYALSGIGSHPPNVRSSRAAKETKSRMAEERFSVRFPIESSPSG